MWHVYVLKSLATGTFYVGMTSLRPEKRLERHNAGRVRSTKSRRPYIIAYIESCESSEEARQREKFLKSGAGREELKTLER